jgi:hypothetical protein
VLRSVGNADRPATTSIKFDPAWKRENLRIIAFVQSRKDRRVLSVGVTGLDPIKSVP